MVVEENSRRQPKLAVSIPATADGKQKIALSVKELYVVKEAVNDVNDAGVVHGHTLGMAKSPEPSPCLPKEDKNLPEESNDCILKFMVSVI